MYVTVCLEFSTKEELEQYKLDNKHKGWKFKELNKNPNCYTLLVEKKYEEDNEK